VVIYLTREKVREVFSGVLLGACSLRCKEKEKKLSKLSQPQVRAHWDVKEDFEK